MIVFESRACIQTQISLVLISQCGCAITRLFFYTMYRVGWMRRLESTDFLGKEMTFDTLYRQFAITNRHFRQDSYDKCNIGPRLDIIGVTSEIAARLRV